MIVTIVTVHVKKENVKEFISATVENHRNSVKEDGNLRFDVLQSREDPSVFTLYEAYASDEASAAHKQTPHYLKWRDTVAGWMEKPRTGIPHNVVAPTDRNRW